MTNSVAVERLDPRSDRSRRALVAAAIGLLDETDAYAITVQDVARRAEVTRPTFYAHFGDLATLFQAAGVQRLAESFGRLAVPPSLVGGAATVAAALRPLLVDLHAHAVFYVRVLRGPGGHDTQAAAIRFLADRITTVSPLGPFLTRDGANASDAATFLAAGAIWLIGGWLESGSADVDEITTRLTALLLSFANTDSRVAR